ncbi:two-component system, OmpR family, sensor histidine kinase QseC [Allopseudospirillum japonicum]|uniref:histidine kinase n=1 Tax=Allopseudospirillum japonicum TaxID=64971 RepID=A0A1H6QCB6_9GAMM|nr:ATP-binding protein [Allopseudospirillum japonicum]SEI39496.1 two-component system, OmpR family, sensor histidine kinase QseC [Allopseudospirillum japonicum]
MRSIYVYLNILLLSSLSIIFISFGAWYFVEANHEVEELMDAELAQWARMGAALFAQETSTKTYEHLAEHLIASYQMTQVHSKTVQHKYEKKLLLSVWNAQGERLFPPHQVQSLQNIQPQHLQAQIIHTGFAWKHEAQDTWRTFTLYDQQDALWIRAAQRADIRGELVEKITLQISLPLLLILPLSWLSIHFGLRTGLAPLARLSQGVAQQNTQQLLPLQLDLPQELTGLQHAFNQFITDLDAAFARERRFTADAAHELRTPLAALKIHLQNAQQAPDQTHSDQSIQAALEGARRLQHLIEQMLTLARSEAAASYLETPHSNLALNTWLSGFLAEYYPLACQSGHELHLATPEQEIYIGFDHHDLALLVRNALDNACKYTPKGTDIDIQLTANSAHALLTIQDQGQSLTTADLQRLGERFVRLQPHTASGSGLGISIMQTLMRKYSQADLSFALTPQGGLKVSMCLPYANQQTSLDCHNQVKA